MRRSVLMAGALSCAVLGVLLARAHTFYTTKITWSKEVSRIVYRNCLSCHHKGGESFSLESYKEARPWAEAIKQQVLSRKMPPWNAVKGFGEFKDERGLGQEDVEVIGEWVEGGAPEGNPAYMPPTPQPAAFGSTGEIRAHPGADDSRLSISGTRTLRRQVEALGIRIIALPPTGAMQIVARRPDGAIQPLIWVEMFNPHDDQTYYFREPLRFAAGTRIEISPQAGSAVLVLSLKSRTE